MPIDPSTLEWLLDGDPVIRWQVMRDLQEAPAKVWQAEHERVATAGWVAKFLSHQASDGSFEKGRWTGTIWMLLLLLDCGVPTHLACLKKAAEKTISGLLPRGRAIDPDVLKTRLDLCHVGFWLRVGSAYLDHDERLDALVKTILDLQMADGGWNCRIRNYPKTTHSSFHTTFNVLEGLREAATAGVMKSATCNAVEAKALKFMLAHRMYQSDKTGKVVDEKMTRLTFPSYWHYTLLRGLDYVATTKFAGDERLADAIALLEHQRTLNGRWPIEGRIAGVTFFDMEKPGSESRWNTLRALRVLKSRANAGRRSSTK